MTMWFLLRTLAEGVSLALLIVVTQLFVFPNMGLLAPSVDGVMGAAFATFIVYTGMTLIYRSKLDEKSG